MDTHKYTSLIEVCPSELSRLTIGQGLTEGHGLLANVPLSHTKDHSQTCKFYILLSSTLLLSRPRSSRILHVSASTSTFARRSTTSGVSRASSSMSAGKNVPGPLTSFLSAAISAAMVNTSTLTWCTKKKNGPVRHEQSRRLSHKGDLPSCGSKQHIASCQLACYTLARITLGQNGRRATEGGDRGAHNATRACDLA